MGALIIGLFFMAIGWIVSARLKSKFREYSQVHLTRDLTGAEVARLMLTDNGIHDVQVTCVEGELSDHYNPANKTVNLSEGSVSWQKCGSNRRCCPRVRSRSTTC